MDHKNKTEDGEIFSGFSRAGMQFLKDLKANNDRDWFRERKEIYETRVKRPMELLVLEAAARCRRNGLPIHAKDKNPVMRVYRDIRFSEDKRPFKTHVSAGLKGSGGGAGHGEIYIHISPEEAFLAAGFWIPERPFLQLWRAAMVEGPEKFLRVVKTLGKSSLELSDEYRLKRLPRGFDEHAGSKIAEALKLTSFVTSRKLSQKECQSAGLVDAVCDFALAAKPLLEYGWQLNYVQPRDILDER